MNAELKLLSSLLPDDEHLSYEELEAAARGAEHEHLQWCETCAAEVEDLRSLLDAPSSGLRPPSPRTRGEGPPPPLPLSPLAERGWRAAPGEGRRRLAAAAALVILALTAFFVARHRTRAEELRLANVTIPAEVLAMRGERLQLRGAAQTADMAVLEPVGTAVVSDRPLFRWSSTLPVEVEVFDERFQPVARSGPLTAREWSPPRPLPRDRTYIWQIVSADRRLAPVPPLPDARFRIVSAEEARAIGEAESGLELASRYAGAGALDDAARELERLLARGEDGDAVRRLRERVQNLP